MKLDWFPFGSPALRLANHNFNEQQLHHLTICLKLSLTLWLMEFDLFWRGFWLNRMSCGRQRTTTEGLWSQTVKMCKFMFIEPDHPNWQDSNVSSVTARKLGWPRRYCHTFWVKTSSLLSLFLFIFGWWPSWARSSYQVKAFAQWIKIHAPLFAPK